MLLSSNSNAKLSTHQISNLFHFDDLNGNKLWLQDASDSFICLGLIQLANIVKKKKKQHARTKALKGRIPSDVLCLILEPWSIFSCLSWWPIKWHQFITFHNAENQNTGWGVGLSPFHKAQEWQEIHFCRMQLPACWFGGKCSCFIFIKAIEELRWRSILASRAAHIPTQSG